MTLLSSPEALKQEFLALFAASGWTQAEAARRLELTRGGFNGLVSGQTTPSPATVKLFKLVLLHEKPDALSPAGAASPTGLSHEELEVLHGLRGMDPTVRDAMVAAVKAAASKASETAASTSKKSDENRRKSLVQPLGHSVAYAPGETPTAPTHGADQALQEAPPSSSSSSSVRKPIVPASLLKRHISKAEYARLRRQEIEDQINSPEARQLRALVNASDSSSSATAGSPPSPGVAGPSVGTSPPPSGSGRRPK